MDLASSTPEIASNAADDSGCFHSARHLGVDKVEHKQRSKVEDPKHARSSRDETFPHPLQDHRAAGVRNRLTPKTSEGAKLYPETSIRHDRRQAYLMPTYFIQANNNVRSPLRYRRPTINSIVANI